MELTLIKIDLDGANLTANAPFSGSGRDTSDTTGSEAAEPSDVSVSVSDEGGRGKAKKGKKGKLAGVSVLGLLVLVVAVLRKMRRGGDDEYEPVETTMDLEEEEAIEAPEDDEKKAKGKGKLAGATLIGLVFLFVVAAVAKKVRGGGAEEA